MFEKLYDFFLTFIMFVVVVICVWVMAALFSLTFSDKIELQANDW